MKASGFTLIELLVVVMIMAVLTAVAMPQYRRSMDRSKAAEAMQMLPALFEARERWMIEHGCDWEDGSPSEYSCPDHETISVRKLDIESNGTTSGNTLTTGNFVYNIVPGETGTGTNQQCVSAQPRWGSSRGLASGGDNSSAAVIWYRGDKFSCTDGTVTGGCAILNVDNGDGDGSCK